MFALDDFFSNLLKKKKRNFRHEHYRVERDEEIRKCSADTL